MNETHEDPWSEAAIEQNRRWLTAYVLSMTGDRNNCQDLVQTVFRIAYEKRTVFKTGTNFGAWLRVIARNVSLAHCRKHSRQPLVDPADAVTLLDKLAAESEQRSVDPSYGEDRKRRLVTCMKNLTTRARMLIRLRYGHGLSLKQIAEKVQGAVSAVNTGIFRARMALSSCMRGQENVEGGAS